MANVLSQVLEWHKIAPWGKLRSVSVREFFLENFAGDLEYHPRRAIVYLALGIASASFWFFSPQDRKAMVVPSIFALGALTLFAKGIFLLRRSSEGLGLSHQEREALSAPSQRKRLPPIAAQLAQVLQDFGAGALLLWPLLRFGNDIDHSWKTPPLLPVFLCGGAIFALGWIMRRSPSGFGGPT